MSLDLVVLIIDLSAMTLVNQHCPHVTSIAPGLLVLAAYLLALPPDLPSLSPGLPALCVMVY
jgi:hypothetical protein